jgi:transposase
MFLRIVRAQSGGTQREYVRLVEAFRENGKTKHRTIVNLGRKDLLVPHAHDLLRILTDAPRHPAVCDADALGAWDWGSVLVARHLWCELGLDKICVRLHPRARCCTQDSADRMFALVANRLCYPTSEHGLARWLETDFVCDSQGQRWEPAWRSDTERLNSKLPRVRVQMKQLKSWYRSLDALFARKELIEVELFAQLRSLFALKVDLVFYDLTSTYFEGAGPPNLGAFGHSRDKRSRNRQVEIGMVMVDGWPIAHHVFAGNVRDSCTVSTVLTDLQARFGIRRIVFVGDRGMITSENLALIRKSDQGYVMGLPRRRRPDVFAMVQRATGPWLSCKGGITNQEKKHPCETKVQEVPTSDSGVRVFVVHSEERLSYECAQRTKAMSRVREELEKLSERIVNEKLRAPEKIGAAATRILQRHHGYRYYDWSYKNGRFSFFEHPINLPGEIACEGKYIIQTEEKDMTAQQAVDIYKQLTEVERSFRCLKDVFDLRPVFHQTDRRVQAHVFVAALAFLLHRALEKKLKAHGLDISASEALSALRTVRVVDLALADGSTKRCVTKGSARAAAILRAVGVADLMPPNHTPTRSQEAPATL